MVKHGDASPQLLIYCLALRHSCSLIVWKIYVWRRQDLECPGFLFSPLSPLLFLSAGASYARLRTPPQAQQDLSVLTMPAPQGSRAACWVPHFSRGIPATAVGLPQECFLTTASVTGTNREQREGERRRKYSDQVGRSRGVPHGRSDWLKDLFWSVQNNFCSIMNEHDPRDTGGIQVVLCL